jgi:hypothetical protein
MARTIDDWMRAAGSETSADGVERVLREAMADVTHAYEWRIVVAGLDKLASVPAGVSREIAERTLAAGIAEREVWPIRDAAAIRARTLGDPGGARQALEAGVQMFEAAQRSPAVDAIAWRGPVRGYEWVLLGQAFATILQDPDASRACLERGRDQARAIANAEDLLSIASAWAEHLDRDGGIAMIAEAERLAANGSARPWSIANAWHALGDLPAVHRVLDRALDRAATAADALHVTHAWACYREVESARAAAVKAETLARGAADWLQLAEAAFDHALGDGTIRHALAAAERELASANEADAEAAADLRARIASAYHMWLGDDAAATRVGPRGLRPGAGRPPLHELPGHDASATALFDHLRASATAEMLEDIAKADYSMDHAKHLAALHDLVTSGVVPRVLAWEPHEVLALTRWSEGERTDHVARGLSCVLLCIAPQDLDELITNGPILLDSCLALGAEATVLAAPFFAWLAEVSEDPEHTIALELLRLAYAARRPADPRAHDIAARIDPEQLAEIDFASSMRSALWAELRAKIG